MAGHRMSMADTEISHDVDAVLVGLSHFKTELLQLHALVSGSRERREGEGGEERGRGREERVKSVDIAWTEVRSPALKSNIKADL